MSGNQCEFDFRLDKFENNKPLKTNSNYAETERFRRIKREKSIMENNMTILATIQTPKVPNFVQVTIKGGNDAITLPVSELTSEQKDALAKAWREDLDKIKPAPQINFRNVG